MTWKLDKLQRLHCTNDLTNDDDDDDDYDDGKDNDDDIN